MIFCSFPSQSANQVQFENQFVKSSQYANKNDNFLKYSFNSWSFIKKHLKDYKNGEWFWGVYEDHSIMKNEDKAGFWKCPYHNGRACIEIIKRIDQI